MTTFSKISNKLNRNDTSGETKMSDETGKTASMRKLLSEVATPTYVVDPPAELLRVVVAAARQVETPPALRVIAPGTRLRSFRSSFRVAARTAELTDAGQLTLRSHELEPSTALVTTETAVYVPLAVGSARSITTVDDPSFHEEAYAWSVERWEAGESFSLRTPPLAAIRQTLRGEFGAPMRESFDAALTTLDRGDEEAFDPVMAVVVVAAHHECLHYDLSRWGERVGFASKATFSRKKKKLERLGVVETEKVSVERGRPRQRLLMTDEYREKSIDSIVASVAY